MATTDENKAARTQQSREVAQDAAEAYRAAVDALLIAMQQNFAGIRDLDLQPLPRGEWATRRGELRRQSGELVRQGRQLGLDVTKMARTLGVSRQTAHEWINEGQA